MKKEELKCACPCSETWLWRYYRQYDAKGCKTCDTWVNKACTDETCEFCKDRPVRPSEAKYAE